MRYLLLSAAFLLTTAVSLMAESPNTFTATFDTERPADWGVNFGSWEAVDGVLVVKQLERDNHAASSRWRIPMADGTIKLKLKFAGATAFHLGFDPAPGTLDKKGHLFSLIVTPTKAELRKHKDKARPESKDQTLATAGFSASENQWMTIELQTVGDTVTATIDNGAGTSAKLVATDSSFHVAKPTVVFRTIGDAVHLDDVNVTVTKSK